MLYPKSKMPFEDEMFQNPGSEYRGTPFWAWNCKMSEDKLDEIVETLYEMGMGGAHIHCRTGMDNPYMGEEFLTLVKKANEKFKKKGMLTWLYDEDRWPSGAGGGMVTKDEKYRIRFLVFSPEKLTGLAKVGQLSDTGQAVRSSNRRLLAHYEVLLRNGWLCDYNCIPEEQAPQEGYEEWYAYLEISGENPWFNNQSYVNTLDQAAMKRFLEVTHKKYKEKLGDEFGKSIPAIFTDEPQFCHKTRLNYANDRMQLFIPYTDDFEETFYAAYGHGILGGLPELFWEKEDMPVSELRYQYHDHVCERFTCAFADTIGSWCKKNNLMLTGHMMEEPTLKSQTAALGEAMRSYRSFQLPGVDMLCDWRELSTVKQAQSAAHQFGCPGVLSELYGVTNWDFDFRGHKLQGDWQAALGVTVRVHHLTWTSMAGEAKRDYPASIGYQSPWYHEYNYVEDYFARINTLLTRGKPLVKIGVIHPIESYWLYWGSDEKTGGIREEMDDNFRKLIQWLLYGYLDFDFISESLLPIQNDESQIQMESFSVGKMKYEVILVPNCETLRKTTFQRLKIFKKLGGKVIFAGNTPKYLDAVFSTEVQDFVMSCTHIPFSKHSVLTSLENNRVVEVRDSSGMLARNMIYQLREEKEERILFLAHVNKMENPDLPKKEKVTITISGKYKITCYEPLDGTKKDIEAIIKNNKTVIYREMYDHDSLLLRLYPISENEKYTETKIQENINCTADIENDYEIKILDFGNRIPITLAEPNVLVLDQAQYRFDDENTWRKREEILRIDNKFRSMLGYPLRMEKFAQPWLNQEQEEIQHFLSLRFVIESEIEIDQARLALENKKAVVWLNGKRCEKSEEWYVDRDICCRKLGKIYAGKNEMTVRIPFTKKENVEAMFLLGEFGVRVKGREAVLIAPVTELSFGDITNQGLPFYGGNIEYQIPIQIEEKGTLAVQITRFRAPLLKVQLGKDVCRIAYSPYQAQFHVDKGEHILKVTVLGNRINTFGTLHNCNDTENWFGPNAWRTEDAQWAYEYQLKTVGILKAPTVSWKQDR